MTNARPEGWIDEIEVENAQVKWGFSHFDGAKDLFNKEGDHNFTLIFPEDQAKQLYDQGWNIKEKPPLNEESESEFILKVAISSMFGMPLIYFIKSGRKYAVESVSELKQIRRDTCENIDVIITPSKSDKWEREDGAPGVSAYVKEMYVTIKESRFGQKYSSEDYEEVK